MYAVDLAGHGRPPRAGRSASVRANRLLDRFLDDVVGGPAVLVGNSMGGTLALLQAAAEPATVLGLVLIGLTSPRARTDVPDVAFARTVARYAVPGVAARAMVRRRERLGPEELVRETLAASATGRRWRRCGPRRSCSRVSSTAWCPSPPPGLSPGCDRTGGWRCSRGVGHVPQIEVPERTARLVREWLGSLPDAELSGHPAGGVA